MAHVLRSYDEPIRNPIGSFHARVVGRAAGDGMWEAWFEFDPVDPPGGETVVSAVESRQPGRIHLDYWAHGLSVVYAEGALDRALHPRVVRPRTVDLPVSEQPAPRVIVDRRST